AGQAELAREMEQYLSEEQRAEIATSLSSRPRPSAVPARQAEASPAAADEAGARPAPRPTTAIRAVIDAASSAEFEEVGDADVIAVDETMEVADEAETAPVEVRPSAVPRPVRGVISQA